jgi:hypothetical protein
MLYESGKYEKQHFSRKTFYGLQEEVLVEFTFNCLELRITI